MQSSAKPRTGRKKLEESESSASEEPKEPKVKKSVKKSSSSEDKVEKKADKKTTKKSASKAASKAASRKRSSSDDEEPKSMSRRERAPRLSLDEIKAKPIGELTYSQILLALEDKANQNNHHELVKVVKRIKGNLRNHNYSNLLQAPGGQAAQPVYYAPPVYQYPQQYSQPQGYPQQWAQPPSFPREPLREPRDPRDPREGQSSRGRGMPGRRGGRAGGYPLRGFEHNPNLDPDMDE